MKSFRTKEDFKNYLEENHKNEKIKIWVTSPRLKDGTELYNCGDNLIYANIYNNKHKCDFTPLFCLGGNYHSRTDAERIAELFKEHIKEFNLQPNDIKW